MTHEELEQYTIKTITDIISNHGGDSTDTIILSIIVFAGTMAGQLKDCPESQHEQILTDAFELFEKQARERIYGALNEPENTTIIKPRGIVH